MNLFEKIFNYQIISRLSDSGTFMITSQERAWLKTMLEHPSAVEAFEPETLEKLQALLESEDTLEISEVFVEKAGSLVKQVHHPLLRQLRRMVANQSGMEITYNIKNGRMFNKETGVPYKLEYSMVKKEWYLTWYHSRHRLMSTRLQNIVEVAEKELPSGRADKVLGEIEAALEKRNQQATIEVVRQYNRELSRILYAFSCFEKDVAYDQGKDTYTIRLTFLNNESEYVLSKIRFLGKRVRVVEGDYMRKRMLETASMALGRYGEELLSPNLP